MSVELLANYFKVKYHNNLMVYKYLTLVEPIFFTWFLAQFSSLSNIKIVTNTIVAVTVFCWLYSFEFSGIEIAKAFNYMRATFSIVVIVLTSNAMLYLANNYTGNLLKNGDVWMMLGLFLFTVLAWVITSTWQLSINLSATLRTNLWNIHSIGNIILNICFTISIWFKSQKNNYIIA